MLLLKNATIIDGTGKKSYRSDIIISGDRIAKIGTFTPKKGMRVINALGKIATPGFIDVATGADHDLSIFTHPEQENYLRQGVTTIIGGTLGASLAPLIDSSLCGIRKWANPDTINVNWQSVKEFFAVVGNKKLGVNFGTLIGGATMHRAIIGEGSRNATDGEVASLKKIATQTMKEGACGYSIDPEAAHAHGISFEEIKSIVGAIKEKKGVYTTTLGKINEALAITKATGAPTIINHLQPQLHEQIPIDEILQKIEGQKQVFFSINPCGETLRPIYTLLPAWARRHNLEAMYELVMSPLHSQKILFALEKTYIPRCTIVNTKNESTLIGKKLRIFALERNMRLHEALFELMRITHLKALLSTEDGDQNAIKKLQVHRRALIASHGAMRGAPFTTYLKNTTQDKSLALEKVIQKITSVPSSIFNLIKRGTIEEGQYADIALFDSNNWHPTHVMVNGSLAIDENNIKEATHGMIAKRY